MYKLLNSLKWKKNMYGGKYMYEVVITDFHLSAAKSALQKAGKSLHPGVGKNKRKIL